MATVIRWSPSTGYGKNDGVKVDYKDSSTASNISKYKNNKTSSGGSSSSSTVDKAISDFTQKTGTSQYHAPTISNGKILYNGYEYDPSYYEIRGNEVFQKSSGQQIVPSGMYASLPQQGNYIDQSKQYIQDMFDQQRKAQLAQLQAARERMKAGFNNQKSSVDQEYEEALGKIGQYRSQANPQFQNQRNQAQIQTAQAANRLRELMAARGVMGGGENISANVSIQNQLQNTLGDINQQQQQYMGELDLQQTDLDREKATRLAQIEEAMRAAQEASSAEELAALSGIGSQQSAALLNAFNQNADRQFQMRNDAVNNYSSYLDNLMKQNTLQQNEQKQSLVNKWLSGEGLSDQERTYLGVDNLDNKDQYVQSIYAKLQQGQPLSPTEQMVIGIYQKPSSGGASPKQGAIDSIWTKYNSGQQLTPDERDLIGLTPNQQNTYNPFEDNTVYSKLFSELTRNMTKYDKQQAMNYISSYQNQLSGPQLLQLQGYINENFL